MPKEAKGQYNSFIIAVSDHFIIITTQKVDLCLMHEINLSNLTSSE